MDEEQLRDAAGDFVAGDLTADEAAAFARLRDRDAGVMRDCRFWDRMRPQLATQGRPPARRLPGPGMAGVVRRRSAREARPQILALAAAMAMAAALALAVLLGAAPRGERGSGLVLAYAEDGSAQVLPASHRSMGDGTVMPWSGARDAGIDEGPAERPWLGVWTQPVSLVQMEQDHGLRVVRIVRGGPSDRAGLRPGDVILSFAGCPMRTRWCIREALRHARLVPGATAPLRYWRPATGALGETRVEVGCCLE